ncbi:MAG: GspE/PulE family protein, partial [Planctomycetota bacterium]
PRSGELLVGEGARAEDDLRRGLEQQRERGELLGECLVRLGCVSEEVILSSLARQLGLEFVDLPKLEVPQEAIEALPLEFVRERRVIPISVFNGTVRIVTPHPGDRRVIEDVRLLSGLEVEEAIAGEEQIRDKISECYQITVERMIEDLQPGHAADGQSQNLHDIEVMASEPTVINLVNLIISAAIRERASDIHLVPFEGELELRYRIDGILQVMQPPPQHLHAALVSRVKIMAQMNIAERYLPQDGHFQIQQGGKRVDVRVGTMPTMHGESLVMRLLEKGARVQSILELGLDRERASALDRVARRPHGIFLATGPTGCGKTTSLYSILHSIHTTEKKILTIEDPVEYELPGVGQIPVRPRRGFTFANGLRSILRQDPDVVMVGEIRDPETAEIAIRAALTGHLVFSTLHTNDAPGAVTRLLDMGIEPFLISSSLEGVMAQRRVRTSCHGWREEHALEEDLAHRLDTIGIEPGPGPHQRGVGCEECRNTGYRGRTGLFEVLLFSPELRQMILEKRPSTEIKAAVLRDMITIREDGLRKVSASITTYDELLRVSMEDL